MAPPKSDTAFRTISEAAEAIGVPQHVLRFWETRFPQLQPLKRGGNRRYYRPADMALLQTIRAMLHDQGLTIRGAQLALADKSAPPRAPAPATPVAAAAPDADMLRGVPDAAALRGIPDVAAIRAVRDRLRAALAA